MGVYLNPGNEKFIIDTSAKIYVDKTGMIDYCNEVLATPQRFICVSRPRRFGKSIAANMIVAYYSRGCDSKEIFQPYEISNSASFQKQMNRYNVIFLNMQEFASQSHSMEEMLGLVRKSVLWDLLEEYPDFRYFDKENLTRTMQFHKFQHYWNQTETFEALRTYIDMNFEGMKDDIIAMMNENAKISIDMRSFTNDMVTFHSKDDVFTLLVHLGYLGYLSESEEVFIPNQEILNEYVTAVSNSDWGEVSRALKNSKKKGAG